MGNAKKPLITRGEFLNFAWALALVALVGQAGVALWHFILPRRKPGSFGEKVVAGRVQEFPPDSISHVQKGRFYISSLQDGSLLALWHRCTHLGCTVPWRDDEGVFHCPCHNSIFNTRGEVLSGPAPRPLDLFPIEIVDEEIVVVDTSTPIERDSFASSQATNA